MVSLIFETKGQTKIIDGKKYHRVGINNIPIVDIRDDMAHLKRQGWKIRKIKKGNGHLIYVR